MEYNINKHESISRRKFIQTATLSAAGLTILPRFILGGKEYVAPSDKINIGIIGAGGRSMGIIKELFTLDDVQLIAVADPAEYWKNDILYSADSGRKPVKEFI